MCVSNACMCMFVYMCVCVWISSPFTDYSIFLENLLCTLGDLSHILNLWFFGFGFFNILTYRHTLLYLCCKEMSQCQYENKMYDNVKTLIKT